MVKFTHLDDEIKLEKNIKHYIDIVVDRVVLNEENQNRISEAISVALDYSKGLLKVETIEGEVKKFSKLHLMYLQRLWYA